MNRVECRPVEGESPLMGLAWAAYQCLIAKPVYQSDTNRDDTRSLVLEAPLAP